MPGGARMRPAAAQPRRRSGPWAAAKAALATLAALAALAGAGCTTTAPAPVARPATAAPFVQRTLNADERKAAFDKVWTTIQQQYVDPRHNGADWPAIGERYRAELLRGGVDEGQFWRGLNRMAGELKDAHTSVRSPLEVNAIVQQRGNFGLGLAKLDGHWVVGGLAGNSQAALLGVRPGHRVLQIDGQAADAWWQATAAAVRGSSTERSRFTLVSRELNQRPVGSILSLGLQRPDGSSYSVTLRQDPQSPAQSLLRSHLLASNLGYLRFAAFLDPLMPEMGVALKRLSSAQGLVLDLRGNGGGSFKMAVEMMGWLLRSGGEVGAVITRDNQRLTMPTAAGPQDTTPSLQVTLQAQPLAMPLAVLIDENSASAAELLAAVLQDRGRARVFGSTSCGCLLGGRSGGEPLPGGGRLMMSLFDMRIGPAPGKRIEGVGVQPDQPVPLTLVALQGQHDVVFEAAQSWLQQGAPGLVAR